MLSGNTPNCLHLYRDRWYPICIHYPAAFRQMLASYATHLFHLHGGSNHNLERIAINNHTQALASIRERLSLTDQPVTEGYLFAILMLACYAHIHGDVKTWIMHMSAIRSILISLNESTTPASSIFISLFQWYVVE